MHVYIHVFGDSKAMFHSRCLLHWEADADEAADGWKVLDGLRRDAELNDEVLDVWRRRGGFRRRSRGRNHDIRICIKPSIERKL